MAPLYLYAYNRRSTLQDHDGVMRSCKTERVIQLLERHWWGYKVVAEDIVPENEFIPFVHGTSNWKHRFGDLAAKWIDLQTVNKTIPMRIWDFISGQKKPR